MSIVTQPLLLRLAGAACQYLLAPFVRVVGRSWRKDIAGIEHLDAIRSSTGGLLVAWHGDLLAALHATRDRDLVGLVSPVWEGELIGRFMMGVGYSLVRGSSGTSPIAGLRSSLRVLKHGRVLATILDGPEGPSQKAKEGAVYLASMAGKPIVPIVVEAWPCIHTPSWDRQKLPPPGARIATRIGEPFQPPTGLSKTEIGEWTRLLEKRMHDLSAEARRRLRK